MKRLTTDNPEGNYESLMNFAKAIDRNVVLTYANGKENMDLCEYISFHSKGVCELSPEEVMDGACLECDDYNCSLGVAYRTAVQAASLRERLKELEDKEESKEPVDVGKLEAPVKIGNGTFGKNTHILQVCPKCEAWVSPSMSKNYCANCGQALDWSKKR